jgi:hypothetical protein
LVFLIVGTEHWYVERGKTKWLIAAPAT